MEFRFPPIRVLIAHDPRSPSLKKFRFEYFRKGRENVQMRMRNERRNREKYFISSQIEGLYFMERRKKVII